jgi:DNA-binding MarR family transcriptional regulator
MNIRKTTSSSSTFLTNHVHVLMCLAKNSSMRIRNISMKVGITERRVQHIIVEFEADGYLELIRNGRRNIYKVYSRKPLQYDIEKHRQVHDLNVFD